MRKRYLDPRISMANDDIADTGEKTTFARGDRATRSLYIRNPKSLLI